MPNYFAATIRAMLAGNSVRYAHLVELQFDTPAYFSNINGTLDADGKVWIGAGQLGSIEGMEQALAGQAVQLRTLLSGADINSQIMQLAASEDRSGYVGQLELIWLQFFDADWQTLDSPYALIAGLMDGISISRQQAENGATIRTVTLTAENIFYNRRVPALGYWTSSDQKQRFPGDLGLDFIPSLQDKVIEVPW